MKRTVLLVGIMIALLVQGLALRESGWKADGVVICDGYFDGGVYPLAIVKDGRGGAIVAWNDSRGPDESIYAQRVDSTGQVHWMENGVCLRSETWFPDKLDAVRDGRGGAIVVWEDYPGPGYSEQIRAQRVDSSGVPRWGSGGKVVTSDPYAWEYWPRIVTDGEKGAIVAWVEWCYYGDSSYTRLYAQRVDSLGRLKWGSTGVLVCNEGTVLDWFPGMVSDRQGGSFITWEDSRAGDRSIYAQRIDSSGILQWAPGGISVCTAGEIQDTPLVVRSFDGSIITWIDKRSGDWDIYAQRIDGKVGFSGSPMGLKSVQYQGLKEDMELAQR